MNDKEFLHAIPFALAAALEEWQQRTDLRDFLLELVPARDADAILEMLSTTREAETRLSESPLSARAWVGESLVRTVPAVAADGPAELGSKIIDLGFTRITGFDEATVEAVATSVARAGGQAGLDCATQFFEIPIGDPIESEVIAIASAAILKLADSKTMDPPWDPATLTGVAHLGLLTHKGVHKEVTDELHPDSHIHHPFEDTIAAVTVALADQVLARRPDIGAGLTAAISELFQYPELAAVIGRTVGDLDAPMLQRPILKSDQSQGFVQATIRRLKSLF